MSIEVQGHFLTLAKGVYVQKIKPDFLRNYCVDLNQTLYESFQVQGNENSNDDPRVTLTYFTARSNLVT